MLILKKSIIQRKIQKHRKQLINVKKPFCAQSVNTIYILTFKYISNKLIIFLTNYLKKKVKKNKNKTKFWITINIKKVVTYKPANLRMGKGKGTVLGSFFFLYHGSTILQIQNIRKGFFFFFLKKIKHAISFLIAHNFNNYTYRVKKKKTFLNRYFKKIKTINEDCFKELHRRKKQANFINISNFLQILVLKKKTKQMVWSLPDSRTYYFYTKPLTVFFFYNRNVVLKKTSSYILHQTNYYPINNDTIYSWYKLILNLSMRDKNNHLTHLSL